MRRAGQAAVWHRAAAAATSASAAAAAAAHVAVPTGAEPGPGPSSQASALAAAASSAAQQEAWSRRRRRTCENGRESDERDPMAALPWGRFTNQSCLGVRGVLASICASPASGISRQSGTFRPQDRQLRSLTSSSSSSLSATSGICRHRPSFFHSSRPDFLPSSPSDRDRQAVGEEEEEAEPIATTPPSQSCAKDSEMHLRRHLPPPGTQLELPGLDQTPEQHRDIWNAISEGVEDQSWRAFVPLLQAILRGEEDVVTLDTRLFDALFWCTVSESPSQPARHLEIFNRARILFEYAGDHRIRVTRQQVLRIVYLYLTAWEQHDLHKVPFVYQDYALSLFKYAKDFDARLTSRFSSRLCTHNMIKEAQALIRRWSGQGQSRLRRTEAWVGTSAQAAKTNTPLLMRNVADIDALAWEHMLECAVRITQQNGQPKPAAFEGGMFALENSNIDPRLSIVRQFIDDVVSTDKLFALLPGSVQRTLDQYMSSGQGRNSEPASVESDAGGEGDLKNDLQASLLPIVAAVLAKRRDLRVARLLLTSYEAGDLSTQYDEDKDNLFAECVIYSSRVALFEQDRAAAVDALQLAHRFFCGCNWHQTRLNEVVHRTLIRAFGRFTLLPRRERTLLLTEDKWITLLRQAVIVILSRDAKLELLHGSGDGGLFHLLRQHVALRDYAFAKRIFIINRSHPSEIGYSPMTGRDFQWLFGSSMLHEPSMTFTSQLLHLWIWSDAIRTELPHIKPTLLIRYVKKMAAHGHQETFSELQDFLVESTAAKVGKCRSAKPVRRLVRLIVDAHAAEANLPVLFLLKMLDFCSTQVDIKDLAAIYCIALEAVALWRSRTTDDDRAALLNSFASFRRQAIADESTRADLSGNDDIRRCYVAALQILLGETGAKSVGADYNWIKRNAGAEAQPAEDLLHEMQVIWQIDSRYDGDTCSLQIGHHLLNDQADAAIILYLEYLEPSLKPPAEQQAQTQVEQSKTSTDPIVERQDKRERRCLPAATATKLALALGCRARYGDASSILATYDRHVPIVADEERQLLEIASLTLLCMQEGMRDYAVQRAVMLVRHGILPLPSDGALRQRILRNTTADELAFSVQQQLHQQDQPPSVVLWSTTLSAPGDWMGQMRNARERLVRWFADEAAATAGGRARKPDRSSAAAERAGISSVACPPALTPSSPSKASPATHPAAVTPDANEQAMERNHEDRRRSRAFAALASGQPWPRFS